MATRTVYYATNRRAVGSADSPSGYSGRPSEDGIENLRLGEVSFTIRKDEVEKRLFKPGKLGSGDGESLGRYYKSRLGKGASIKPYPEKLVDSKESPLPASEQKLGSRRLFEELRKCMLEGHDALVYVHGYSVDWRSAVASAAALEDMLNRRPSISGKRVLVLLFTWPSDGKKIPWMSYASDRKEAADSGLALGRGLLKLRDYLGGLAPADYCGQNLHVLCHSMGNWVLRNALERILEFGGPRALPRILDNIFMCSPDVDDNDFDNHAGHVGAMLPLLDIAKSVSVYHNRGDAALVVSDTTKGNANRLGTNGAAHPQTLHARVQQVDCSDRVQGLVEHSYYMVGSVNDDIRQTIDDTTHDSPERNRKRGPFPNAWLLV